MNIVISEYNLTGNSKGINVLLYQYDLATIEDAQKLFEATGIENEKVIGLYKISDKDPMLSSLFASLCNFGNETEGHFQCSMEKLFTEVFALGREYGEKNK
jgi:hypothetical protein